MAGIRHSVDKETGSVGYTLALITLFVAIAGLGLAYLASAWFEEATARRADPSLAATHLVTVGAQHYVIPAALLPDPTQRRDGFADRLDMTLALPVGENGALTQVELTLMPRGRVRTSAALLDSVYLHQFSAAQLQGPPGLVGKPLTGDAGTSGETVWYDPLSAAPFVAKCMTPVDMRTDARTCLRAFQLSDRNTAILSFEPAALRNWRQFDAIVESWLQNLRK